MTYTSRPYDAPLRQALGEDMIISQAVLRDMNAASCLTFAQIVRLSRESLYSLIGSGEFPRAQRSIRKAAIRITLQRTIMRVAETARLAKTDLNLMQAYRRFKTSQATSAVRTFDVERPIESRVSELDEKVELMGKALGAQLQQVLTAVTDLQQTAAASAGRGGAAAIAAKSAKLKLAKSKNKSVPPPLPRGTVPQQPPPLATTVPPTSELTKPLAAPAAVSQLQPHTGQPAKPTLQQPVASSQGSSESTVAAPGPVLAPMAWSTLGHDVPTATRESSRKTLSLNSETFTSHSTETEDLLAA